MNISVFGGSEPKEGSLTYFEALELGRQLAHAVIRSLLVDTLGTMEAVWRGATEAGGTLSVSPVRR